MDNIFLTVIGHMIWNASAQVINHSAAAFGQAVNVGIPLEHFQTHLALEEAIAQRNGQTVNGRRAVCTFGAQTDERLHFGANRLGFSVVVQKVVRIVNKYLEMNSKYKLSGAKLCSCLP